MKAIRPLALGACALLLGACAALQPTKTLPPSFFLLDAAQESAAAPRPAAAGAPTLIVNPPHAAAGYASQRIIYMREVQKLEYFAHNEWVDPPARMLAPLLAGALARTGAFRAVMLTPSAATGELRLDTEIVRLQHEFLAQPSHVRFTLRAWLIEEKGRRVVAWREFDATVPAASEDPRGGVVAANRAVGSVLEQLAVFCADAARNHRPGEKSP